VVLDAGCRDVADLTAMRFPVWSRHVSAFGCIKETLGSVNVGVTCAGQWIEPGDVVVADDDGVVVVPRGRAADVLQGARAREQREAGIRERYRNGELGLDMNNMRGPLAAKGLTYVDQEPPL
jgi:4-hydroxy-4-methyl-2-oxoglutarate aldolase